MRAFKTGLIIFAITCVLISVLPAECSLKFPYDTDKQSHTTSNFSEKQKHEYFRSHADFFYQSLQKLGSTPLFQYFGFLYGDAHIENFGVLSSKHRDPIFTGNDYDESDYGPIYFDFLRFACSAKIVNSQIDILELKNAYISGLKGEIFTYSKFTQELFKRSLAGNSELDTKFVDSSNQKFIKYKAGGRSLSVKEFQKLKAFFQKILPDYDFLDAYIQLKPTGGSSGLNRFHMLVYSTQESRLLWFELKEQKTSSFGLYFKTPFSEINDRLSYIEKSMARPLGSQHYTSIPYDGSFYILRETHEGNQKVSFKNVKKHPRVTLDEAFSLGQLHASFSINKSNRDAYIHELVIQGVESIENQVDYLLDAIFKKLD